MKRRGFFGAMAGLFGAPVAAGAIIVTKQANDVFGEPGKLVEARKPLAAEMQRECETFMSCTTMTAGWTPYRTAQWNEGTVICKYCRGREFRDYTSCRHCGAPL